MEIKSIQLAADSDPSYPARLAFTLDLADILSASVTVVHAMATAAGHAAVGRAASPVYLEALKEGAEERAEALRAETIRIAEEKGHDPRWISDTREVREIVVREALLSDLTVVGRGRETTLEDWVRDHLVDYLSKTVATPILYVPPMVPEHVVMGRVLIAWDGSHPAMRAVRGALPFLRRAREVHVVAIGKPDDPERGAATTLRDYLGRYRIDAVAHGNETEEKDAARAIHAMVDTLGANWMIMGANSKPKLQTLLFGSMTRALMKDTKIPLLMSALRKARGVGEDLLAGLGEEAPRFREAHRAARGDAGGPGILVSEPLAAAGSRRPKRTLVDRDYTRSCRVSFGGRIIGSARADRRVAVRGEEEDVTSARVHGRNSVCRVRRDRNGARCLHDDDRETRRSGSVRVLGCRLLRGV